MIVQSWLIYRRHSNDMGTSRKEQLSLLDFKLDIALYLCVKSELGVKRKGRPIVLKPSSTYCKEEVLFQYPMPSEQTTGQR